MKTRPKIKYPCGCYVHINGPDDFRNSLRIESVKCKKHAKIIKAMREMVQSNHDYLVQF